MTTTKRKTPNLAFSNVLKYLHQLFKIPVEHCRDLDDAIEVLQRRLRLPTGFDLECAPIFLPDRFSLRAVLWEMNKKSALAQTIAEVCDDSVYLLLADETMSGKHSLMFCACGFADKETAAEDILYHVDAWTRASSTIPKIITTSIQWDDDTVLFICAMQLSTFTPTPTSQ